MKYPNPLQYFVTALTIALGLALSTASAQVKKPIVRAGGTSKTLSFIIDDNADARRTEMYANAYMDHPEELRYFLSNSHGLISVSNRNAGDGGGKQYIDITYNGRSVDWNTTPALPGSSTRGRGYDISLWGCPPGATNNDDHCGLVYLTVLVVNRPELRTMRGTLRITETHSVDSDRSTVTEGDVYTLDASTLYDSDGINPSFVVYWNKGACGPTLKGIGHERQIEDQQAGRHLRYDTFRNRTTDRSNYTVGQSGSEKAGTDTLSVYFGYQDDESYTKWVCKDIGPIVAASKPVPRNLGPTLSTGYLTFSVKENEEAEKLTGTEAYMTSNIEDPTIIYILEPSDGATAREWALIRSLFRVQVSPSSSTDLEKKIELHTRRGLNYEENAEYNFKVKGFSTNGLFEVAEVNVIVKDEIEIGLLQGNMSFSGRLVAGEEIVADMSRLSDVEAVDGAFEAILWMGQTCPTPARGTGDPFAGSGSHLRREKILTSDTTADDGKLSYTRLRQCLRICGGSDPIETMG